jgi:rhomboid protease GluP
VYPTEPTPGPGPGAAARHGRVTPYFSYGLIAASVAIYALSELQWGGAHPFALRGAPVRAGEWWRVLTFNMEHGNVLHLVMNMSAVWSLGTVLESVTGTYRFTLISIACALGSAAAVLLLDFNQATVGASGMILGWMGAMLPIASKYFRRELWTSLIFVAILSVGFRQYISWEGHLGGFLWGVPCGIALKSGPRVHPYVLPVLVFLAAIAAFVAGTGRYAHLFP